MTFDPSCLVTLRNLKHFKDLFYMFSPYNCACSLVHAQIPMEEGSRSVFTYSSVQRTMNNLRMYCIDRPRMPESNVLHIFHSLYD